MDYDKSRSQKKRESSALQRIGEELILLPLSILETLNLPQDLFEAILFCQTLPPDESRRRQTQYVGKLMRRLDDPETLQEAVEEAKAGLQTEARHFQRIELVRDSLIHQEKDKRTMAFQDFLHAYPQCDANKLRALVKAAIDEEKKALHSDKPGKGSTKPKGRALFRWLRETMDRTENSPTNTPSS